MTADPTTIRRLYGRRQTHRLRGGQSALVEELLPTLSVPDGPLDAAALFGDDRPLEFEIWFGSVEHLAAQAEARVAAQASDDERLAVADVVLDGAGAEEDLRRQVDDLWERIGAERVAEAAADLR